MRHLLEDIRWEYGYRRAVDGDSAVGAVARMAWDGLLHCGQVLLCRTFGHDLTCDGVDPESGGESLRCKRCGQTWWHHF